jgi:hypothetical protein
MEPNPDNAAGMELLFRCQWSPETQPSPSPGLLWQEPNLAAQRFGLFVW